MNIILIFAIKIIFNVIFPTADVGSDLYLSYNTITFAGHSRTLVGCRACYDKRPNELYEISEPGCKTCFQMKDYETADSDGAKVSTENQTFYTYDFGTVACRLEIIDKAIELQSHSKKCNEKYQLKLEGNDAVIRSDECKYGDHCCIERVNNLKLTELETDKEIDWYDCVQNNLGCEMCLGAGNLGFSSCQYLRDITDPLFTESAPYHKISYPWHIKNRQCSPLENTVYYKINNFTVRDGKILNVNYKQGPCLKSDQCCVRFKYTPAQYSKSDGFKLCYSDVCNLILKERSIAFNRRLNLDNWKKNENQLNWML